MAETSGRDRSISEFYANGYRTDHSTPANIALHMFGTIAALGLLIACATVISGWWALLFPVIHAAPGLLGHRLFERNAEIGDVRVLRNDYPAWWFIIANHRMTWDVLTGRY
jgi:hypothetical protein